MSAVYSGELKGMVRRYIDGDRYVVDKLKKGLESTSAEIRFSLMKDVRDGEYSSSQSAASGFQSFGTKLARFFRSVFTEDEWNVLHESARRNDVEMMKCLLDEFSSDQMWQALKIGSNSDSTPLHQAARNGSTDTAKYLLESTPDQFKYEYLQRKGRWGNTALHDAAKNNHLETVQVLLSFLSPKQQISLLKETNRKNQSVADILSAKYPQDFGVRAAGMVIALEAKLTEQKVEHDGETKEMNDKLAKQEDLHDRAFTAADQKQQTELAEQKAEHDREMQAMKEKQAELDRKLARLDVYLRQIVDVNEVEDQEVPHSD